MPMQESVRLSTIKSFLWKLLERLGNSFIQIALQIVLARLLAPKEFGALAVIMVLVNVGNLVVQSGLNTALVQVKDLHKEDASTVFWMSLCTAVVLYIVVFAISPAVADFYALPELLWPLRCLACLLLINSYGAVQVALLQRQLAFKKFVKATMLAGLVSGVVGVFLAFLGIGLWALVSQQVLYHSVNCLLLSRTKLWTPLSGFSFQRARILFRYGWKLMLSGLLDQSYQSLSDLIIGKYFSPASLGFVSQGKRYPQSVGMMLDGAIQPVMLATIAQVQGDKEQIRRIVRRALMTSSYVVVPVMVLLAVAAKPLVLLLIGEQWISAVPFIQMYCFVYALLPIHSTNLQALNGVGRSDVFLRLELIKKSYGVCLTLVAAFVCRDVHLLVSTYILTGLIATFVNSFPSGTILGYSFKEQVKDNTPTFCIGFVSAFLGYSLLYFALDNIVVICLQFLVVGGSYLLLGLFFKVEALRYLCAVMSPIVTKHVMRTTDRRKRKHL